MRLISLGTWRESLDPHTLNIDLLTLNVTFCQNYELKLDEHEHDQLLIRLLPQSQDPERYIVPVNLRFHWRNPPFSRPMLAK